MKKNFEDYVMLIGLCAFTIMAIVASIASVIALYIWLMQ